LWNTFSPTRRWTSFHGLIVHTVPLPARHLYADANQIAELRERGVVLSVGREDLHELRARQSAWAARDVPRGLEPRLRRVWDWLTTRRGRPDW
jgi:hypothetical protein